MRILTGDECGLLKESIPEASRNINPTERGAVQASANCEGVSRLDLSYSAGGSDAMKSQQTRRRGIVGLTFLPSSVALNDDSDESGEREDRDERFAFAALRVNGSVETWSGSRPLVKRGKPTEPAVYKLMGTTSDSVFSSTSKSDSEEQQAIGRPIGICGSTASAITSCVDSMGRLSLLDLSKADIDNSIVAQYDAFSGSKNKTIPYTKGNFSNNDIATALAMDATASRVAIGGRERETTLLDVESGSVLWKAKNLRPDLQTLLQHPIWTTALDFVGSTGGDRGGDNIEIGGSNNLLAVGTAYKQFRIYDVRVSSGTAQQRRPILCTKDGILSHRVTALCQLDGYSYVVGDASGDVHSLDLRNLGKGTIGRYAGPGGSIRRIVKHPTLPVLACVSLDRMLRTFDVKSRRMLDCVYLKQRLSSMLFCDDGTWSVDGEGGLAAADGEDSANYINMMYGEEGGDINEADEVEDYVDSDEEEEDDDDDDVVADMRNGGGEFESKDDDSDEDDATASLDGDEALDDESSEEEDVFAAASSSNKERQKRGGRGNASSGKKKRRK